MIGDTHRRLATVTVSTTETVVPEHAITSRLPTWTEPLSADQHGHSRSLYLRERAKEPLDPEKGLKAGKQRVHDRD